jgi:hypothetical protein
MQEKWRRFHLLEPLLEQWKEKAGWLEEEEVITSMVREQLGLTTASQEELLRISAICNTNSFRYHVIKNFKGSYLIFCSNITRLLIKLTDFFLI